MRTRRLISQISLVGLIAGLGTAQAHAEPSVITLVTGDQVQISAGPSYGFKPAKGREGIGFFHAYRSTGEQLVVPIDAMRLDRAGFTVGRAPVRAREDLPTLAVHVIDRQGAPSTTNLVFAINTKTGYSDWFTSDGAGTESAQLEPGTYDVNVTSVSDTTGVREVSVVNKLAVEVTAAGAETTLDTRTAKPVTVRVDQPGAKLVDGTVDVRYEAAGTSAGSTFFTGPGAKVYAAPGAGVVVGRKHTFAYRPVLAGGSFRYQLAFVNAGGLPNGASYYTPDRRLAKVENSYYAQGLPGTTGIEGNNGRLAAMPGLPVFRFFDLAVPGERTEYYTADPGVTWFTLRVLSGAEEGQEVAAVARSLPPGTSRTTWLAAPLGVTWGDPQQFRGISRTGDQLALGVPAFAPGDGKRYVYAYGSGEPGKTTLSLRGKEIGTSETVGQGEFTLPAAKGRYTLTTSGTRQEPYSNLTTTSTAEWTFDSATTAEDTRLPLPLLRIGLGRGTQNPLGQVRAGSSHEITLTADPQPGSAPVGLRGAPSLELSYDDGRVWRRAPVGRVVEPCEPGFVSLRAKAVAVDGSTVTQTLIRAYELVK